MFQDMTTITRLVLQMIPCLKSIQMLKFRNATLLSKSWVCCTHTLNNTPKQFGCTCTTITTTTQKNGRVSLVIYVYHYCYKGHSCPLTHKCAFHCNVCITLCDHQASCTIKCKDCKRICQSQLCYNTHKQYSDTHQCVSCKKVKYCEYCCIVCCWQWQEQGKKGHP